MRKESILGTKPVNGLIVSMSLPIMFSMLVQALYNIVDSIFVAQISENALTAVSLAFPVQNLMIAVAVGTAVGINALLSRNLGEKKHNEANKVANNGLFITIISWAVFAVLGLLLSNVFYKAFTSIDNIIVEGTKYLQICTVFSVGVFVQITMERILQVTGKTVYQMIAQLAGAITNIILDPILIFGLLGAPKMGVAGAAIATVIGQLVGMTIAIIINHFKNHEVRLTVKGCLSPCAKTIKGIYRVGFPSIIMQSIGSIMVFGMNKILIEFTETAVSVFGIYFKLQSFVFMPVFGITNAMVPIIGYNYGARNKKRITQAIKMALIMITGIMILGTIIFQVFPEQLLNMFNPTPALISIGVPALRIISLCFILAGFGITFSCVFQALGDGIASLIVSIVRQLVFILPCAWILAQLFGINAVWLSFVLAEFVSMILALAFFKRTYDKKISVIEKIEFK